MESSDISLTDDRYEVPDETNWYQANILGAGACVDLIATKALAPCGALML